MKIENIQERGNTTVTEKLRENLSQQEAINTIDGPVIIVSCPGSGKTTTLIRRIHHMVE